MNNTTEKIYSLIKEIFLPEIIINELFITKLPFFTDFIIVHQSEISTLIESEIAVQIIKSNKYIVYKTAYKKTAEVSNIKELHFELSKLAKSYREKR